MNYKIKTFAVLKDLLGDSFEISAENNSIESLKNALIKRNSLSKKVLDSSRFAIDNTFVDADYEFIDGQIILIMPPSSGG